MTDSNYRELLPIEKCLRCGYNEILSSLHVHHLDHDRKNNSLDNLVVLCANCHYGLHHNAWDISEIGITVNLVCKEKTATKEEIESQEITESLCREKEDSIDPYEIIEGLKQEIEQLQAELNKHEESCKKSIEEEKLKIHRNFVLFRYVAEKLGYTERDFIVFLFDKIPLTWYRDLVNEYGKEPEELLKCAREVFEEYYCVWKKYSSTVFPINKNLQECKTEQRIIELIQ